jgi:hypothetical protein
MAMFSKRHYEKIIDILAEANNDFNSDKEYHYKNFYGDKIDYIKDYFIRYFKIDNCRFNQTEFDKYFDSKIKIKEYI